MCQDKAVNKCPYPMCPYFVGGYGQSINKCIRSKQKNKTKQHKEDRYFRSQQRLLISWYLLLMQNAEGECGSRLCRYLEKDQRKESKGSGFR